MTPYFHPRLVNGPFQDPALYIDLLYQGRALLFDAGDISTLAARHIQRVSDIFVTHTHMDHFIGLDHIIRLFLGREKRLTIYGPPRIIANVQGKISAYTWNLVNNYESIFEIEVKEFHPDHTERAMFRCTNTFQREDGEPSPFSGTLMEDQGFSVKGALLDHCTPCLGFCLEEEFHINIQKDRLDAMGLPAGPWLTKVKEAVRQGMPEEFSIGVSARVRGSEVARLSLGQLREAGLFTISRGQKIAYIADIGYTEENISRLIPLIQGADHLFCEAAFLDIDRDIAKGKCHLTARQAGVIACEAGVRRLVPFHFSPRYYSRPDLLYKEAEEAFNPS